MKATIDGIYLKVGQYVNIDGKAYKFMSYNMTLAGSYILKFEYDKPYVKGQEPEHCELELKSEELKNALGLQIYGYFK